MRRLLRGAAPDARFSHLLDLIERASQTASCFVTYAPMVFLLTAPRSQSPLWGRSAAREAFIAWAINKFSGHSAELEVLRCSTLRLAAPMGPTIVEIGPGPGRRARALRTSPSATAPHHKRTCGGLGGGALIAMHRDGCALRSRRPAAAPCRALRPRSSRRAPSPTRAWSRTRTSTLFSHRRGSRRGLLLSLLLLLPKPKENLLSVMLRVVSRARPGRPARAARRQSLGAFRG